MEKVRLPAAFVVTRIRPRKICPSPWPEGSAVGLAISRDYQFGWIYVPVYLCRGWVGNTDAEFDVTKSNTAEAQDFFNTLALTPEENAIA